MNENETIQEKRKTPKKRNRFKKGNKSGVLFSNRNQPGNRGRKPTRLNNFLKSIQMEKDFELISKEDAYKLLAMIIFCNRAELEKMTKSAHIPIFMAGIIKAIIVDTANGTIDTVEKVFDRLYGKGNQPIELTGAGGTPLIPTEPMSRKEYERLLSELKCESKKIVNN